MPGFVGFVDWSQSGRTSASFRRALHALAKPELVTITESGGALWAIGRADLEKAHDFWSDESGRRHAVWRGDRVVTGQCSTSYAQNPAKFLSERFRHDGVSGAAQIASPFSAALVDEDRRFALLATDRFGSYPVYWKTVGSLLAFATELRPVMLLAATPHELDPRAVADFVTFGLITGTRTLAATVQLLDAGCVLEWQPNAPPRITRYADLAALFGRSPASRRAYVNDVGDAFREAVRRSSRERNVALALSGGLDSRAILSVVGQEVPQPASYTLGQAGCADQVIADRLSALVGTRHSFIPIDEAYLSGFGERLREMVALTDGMYLSQGFTEILALRHLRTAGFAMLLRGHGGELAKSSLAWPFHTDAAIFGMKSTTQLVEHLLRRFEGLTCSRAWYGALAPKWRRPIVDGPRHSLGESLGNVALSPPDLCSYLYIREQHRRLTIPSLELFRNAVSVRLPFMDADVLRVLLAGPPEWRRSTALHLALLSRFDRRLLAVRDSNTGIRPDASRVRSLLADKFNSALRRLQIFGFLHYHDFSRWVQHGLMDAVESELLSDRALDRGVMTREGLVSIIDGARRGAAGYSYLLQTLLIIEIWQQQTMDVSDATLDIYLR
jgi:asparagine synthase (glutamine-hydrolysing)